MKRIKNRIWLLIVIVLVTIGAVFCYFWLGRGQVGQIKHLCDRGPYCVSIPIVELSSGAAPHIEVKAGDSVAKVKLDLGCFADVTNLPSSFTQRLNKTFKRKGVFYGIRGKKYITDIYEIPEISFGNVTVHPVCIGGLDPEFERDTILRGCADNPQNLQVGRVGWPLFYNCNLFMDCTHALLAASDGLETLKNKGYATGHFVETNLLLERNFIEFIAITEKGPMRCVLDTGATVSLINKNSSARIDDDALFNATDMEKHFQALNPENKDAAHFDLEQDEQIADFTIGNHSFGSILFKPIDTPLPFEAIIGMDFLYSRQVFIDFYNRKIYFSKDETIPLFSELKIES